MRAYNRDMIEVDVDSHLQLLPRMEVNRAVRDAMERCMGVAQYRSSDGNRFVLVIQRLFNDGPDTYRVLLSDRESATVYEEISTEEDMILTYRATETSQ